MRAFVRMCAVMACGLWSVPALAVNQLPPDAKNVCHRVIQNFAEQERVLNWGIVKINAMIERDGGLSPGLYGDLADKIRGPVAGLSPVKGSKADLERVREWSNSSRHGMWLVVLPGIGPNLKAQVFIAGKQRGKPMCLPLYEELEPIHVDALPEDILD